MNAALPKLHQQIEAAKTALVQAKTALRPIPAKVAATDLDPNAKRARPRIERRGLQMVRVEGGFARSRLRAIEVR